jgi:hypothetical protein
MRQPRLLPRLRRLREHRAAMAICRGDERSGHVVAEGRPIARMSVTTPEQSKPRLASAHHRA